MSQRLAWNSYNYNSYYNYWLFDNYQLYYGLGYLL
jgi:hypothetical protein